MQASRNRGELRRYFAVSFAYLFRLRQHDAPQGRTPLARAIRDIFDPRTMGQQDIDRWPILRVNRPHHRSVALPVLRLRAGAMVQDQGKTFGPVQRGEEPWIPA